MVGRELTETYPPRGDCIKKDDVVLELKNVTGNGDRNISLQVHRGEILGLGGLVGAGRTETMRAMYGLDPHEQDVQNLLKLFLERQKNSLDRSSLKEKKSTRRARGRQ